MRNKIKDHTSFPVKRCVIASIVIILVFLIVLTLPISIIYSKDDLKYGWVLFLIWGILFAASLITYWIIQIVKFIKIRKDENTEKN